MAETAFFVENGNNFHIRWFTPMSEVDFCGHATLASAYFLLNILNFEGDKLEFDSKSGILTVERENDLIKLSCLQSKTNYCQ